MHFSQLALLDTKPLISRESGWYNSQDEKQTNQTNLHNPFLFQKRKYSNDLKNPGDIGIEF